LYNYQSFPKRHWRRVKTTNTFGEGEQRELKRQSRVVGAFPNERLLVKLAVATLIDVNEERLTGRRRYLDTKESNL